MRWGQVETSPIARCHLLPKFSKNIEETPEIVHPRSLRARNTSDRKRKKKRTQSFISLSLIARHFNQDLDFISYSLSILLGCSLGFNQSEKGFFLEFYEEVVS
jgi:hypothetical protein